MTTMLFSKKYLVALFTVFECISCTQFSSLNIDCQARLDECISDPTNDAKGPICGTDNHTYRSLCSLILAQCQNGNVQKQYDGQCAEQQPCLQALNYAQSRRAAGITGLLIPRCRPDGMYAAVQCQDSGGSANSGDGINRYCWCVTPQGIAVPNSTVRTGRPHCGHHRRQSKIAGKAKTARRFSRGGGRKPRQGCKLADKRIFNSNLIKIFKSEWNREVGTRPEHRTENEIDRIVLDWKFSALDKNSNDNLEYTEYADIKKIVKKNVKPKRCARQFTRTCDLNRDQIISRHEWVDCLSRNAIDDNSSRIWSGQSGQMGIDEEDDEDIEDFKVIDDLRHPKVLQSMPTSETLPPFSDDSEEPPMDSDCQSDRRANEQQSPNIFIPECTPDGRYKTVQCYTDYCWCVNADTGKDVKGTMIKGTLPKCDQISSNSRSMKGCPDNRKVQFINDLVDFFIQQMGTAKFDNGQKRVEKAATWSFNHFDRNDSKMLEKKEWKQFRAMVEEKKHLRHCGKKMPRFCDTNSDRKISLDEWNNCLGVTNGSSNSKTVVPRKKVNPLETILKSD